MKSTEAISSGPIKKTELEEFDLVILGGGTGSTIAAWTFGGEGKRVAVIERKYIGGSCPNIACLPSKNIIHSAKVASYFRRSQEFGISRDRFTIDMSGVHDRKRKMVSGLNEVYLGNYNGSLNHAVRMVLFPRRRSNCGTLRALREGIAVPSFAVCSGDGSCPTERPVHVLMKLVSD
jgi:hypothetical protein